MPTDAPMLAPRADACQSPDPQADRSPRAVHPPEASSPADLLQDIEALRGAVDAEGRATLAQWRPAIRRRAFLPAALNLAHYLAFRRRDLRDLQEALIGYGLSSLGRAESRGAAQPGRRARQPRGASPAHRHLPPWPPARATGRGLRLLQRNTAAVLGPADGPRRVRIMVTVGADAAEPDGPIPALVAAGADVVRLNCAKGDPAQWAAIVDQVRRAEAATGRSCRVAMDLCGPRARTGAVATPADRDRLVEGDRLLLRPGTGTGAAGHSVPRGVLASGGARPARARPAGHPRRGCCDRAHGLDG